MITWYHIVYGPWYVEANWHGQMLYGFWNPEKYYEGEREF